MTEFTLNAGTRRLIQTAITNQGTNVAANVAAYNAIYREILDNPAINAGTQYWFSQSGSVNNQANSPSAAGTFIWN